ncbi:MAG: SDR family NAD(P)-dependent oxidoreductase [Candidatus Peregrinibacteria bacterium]
MFDLTGKVALVTGGERGMGRSHCLVLAKQGAKVAVTGRNKEHCQTVADEITSAGGEAIALEMDVTKPDQISSIISEIVAKYGRLDILVNNAGIFKPVEAIKMTDEQWAETIQVNLTGEFLCAQAAAKEMAKNKWGRIINITSVASGQVGIGFMNSAHYTASKGGIIGMTETLAIEWAPLGILVNAIAPGAIDTPMISEAGMSKEALDGLLMRVPLHRMGKSEEVSAAVAFLASDEASYITGSTIYVDGGWLAA